MIVKLVGSNAWKCIEIKNTQIQYIKTDIYICSYILNILHTITHTHTHIYIHLYPIYISNIDIFVMKIVILPKN